MLIVTLLRLLLLPGLLLTKIEACLMDRERYCRCAYKKIACTGLTDSVDTILPNMIRGDTRILHMRKVWVDDAVELGPWNFDRLKRLVEVDFSHNRITVIHPHTFSNMMVLSVLNLSHNRLKLFEVDVLSGKLPKLERLDLSSNKLLILVNRNFMAANYLKHLDLRHNHILFIAPEAFWGLSSLQVLEMSGANLTKFPAESLCSPTNLRRLHLRDMPYITEIPPHAFNCNKRLEELVLERFPRFSLRGLSPETFDRNNKLRRLTIASCNLTAVPSTALRKLTNLEELDLSRNLISVIYSDDFRELTSLRRIVLRSTGLCEIKPRAFAKHRNIQSLDVSHNRLSTLYDNVFPMNISSLRNVTMTYNAWSCDCAIRWLVESDINLGEGPVTCTLPSDVQGMSILDMTHSLPDTFYNCTGPFLNGPRSEVIMVPEGGIARLFCDVLGVPPLTATWTRGGITVGSGKRLILKAQRHNAGTYTCLARNAGGSTSKIVTLKIAPNGKGAGTRGHSSGPYSDGAQINGVQRTEPERKLLQPDGYSSIAIADEIFERSGEGEASWKTTAPIAVLGCSTGIGLIIMCILVIMLWKKKHHRGMIPAPEPPQPQRYREHNHNSPSKHKSPMRNGKQQRYRGDGMAQMEVAKPVGGQGIYSRPIEMTPVRDTEAPHTGRNNLRNHK